MDIESLVSEVIDAAFTVRQHLSEGYLENVYKNALLHELALRGIAALPEYDIKVSYKGVCVGAYRADLLVDNRLIVELKAVSELSTASEVQLVNYLTATGIDHGLLINFGAPKIDIRRKFRVYRPRKT